MLAFRCQTTQSGFDVARVHLVKLLDVRDESYQHRFSPLAIPAIVAGVLLLAALLYGIGGAQLAPAHAAVSFSLQQFSAAAKKDLGTAGR